MNKMGALVPAVNRATDACSVVVRFQVDRPRYVPLVSSRPDVRTATWATTVFEGKRSDVTGIRGEHGRAGSHELPVREGLGVFLFVPCNKAVDNVCTILVITLKVPDVWWPTHRS